MKPWAQDDYVEIEYLHYLLLFGLINYVIWLSCMLGNADQFEYVVREQTDEKKIMIRLNAPCPCTYIHKYLVDVEI